MVVEMGRDQSETTEGWAAWQQAGLTACGHTYTKKNMLVSFSPSLLLSLSLTLSLSLFEVSLLLSFPPSLPPLPSPLLPFPPFTLTPLPLLTHPGLGCGFLPLTRSQSYSPTLCGHFHLPRYLYHRRSDFVSSSFCCSVCLSS